MAESNGYLQEEKEKRRNALCNILRARRFNQQVADEAPYYTGSAPASLEKVLESEGILQEVATSTIMTQKLLKDFNEQRALVEMASNPSTEQLGKLKKLAKLSIELLKAENLGREKELKELLDENSELFKKLKDLKCVKERAYQNKQTSDATRSLIEKAERELKKLNIMHRVTDALIGSFIHDHEKFPEIQQKRTALRNDLTLPDFFGRDNDEDME